VDEKQIVENAKDFCKDKYNENLRWVKQPIHIIRKRMTDIHIRGIHGQTMEMDYIQLQKMVFICNAVENGWEVKKRDDKYIFNKKHEGKKEVYLESYLQKFIEKNLSLVILK